MLLSWLLPIIGFGFHIDESYSYGNYDTGVIWAIWGQKRLMSLLDLIRFRVVSNNETHIVYSAYIYDNYDILYYRFAFIVVVWSVLVVIIRFIVVAF